jgi:hypothetical protein
MYNQLASALRFFPLLASQNLVEQKVLVRRYLVNPATPTCVRFQADVGPGRFVRINDLEGRRKEAPYLRASEKSLSFAN